MKKAFLYLVVLMAGASSAYGAADMGISRGGFGFLFPDNNSFVNPGQFTQSSGTSLQAMYGRTTMSGISFQDANASVVYGNGRIGFGAYGNRMTGVNFAGTNLTGTSLTNASSATDSMGAGLGVALVRDRLNLGVGYGRQISPGQINQGAVNASLTLMGNRGHGVYAGIGASTTIKQTTGFAQTGALVPGYGVGGSSNGQTNGNTQTGTVALGYAFRPGVNVEGTYVRNDFNNSKDYNLGAYVNVASPVVYFSTGYNWVNVRNHHDAMARLGFIMGRHFDFSAFGSYEFYSGSNPVWGGSLRVTL